MCARLYVERCTVIPEECGNIKCVCGCSAWFCSRITVFELIGFWIGFNKDCDVDLLQHHDVPLGGRTSLVNDVLETISV